MPSTVPFNTWVAKIALCLASPVVKPFSANSRLRFTITGWWYRHHDFFARVLFLDPIFLKSAYQLRITSNAARGSRMGMPRKRRKASRS